MPSDGRGGARSGTGPKPRPPETHRRNRVTIAFDDADLSRLQRLAGKGESVAGYIRRLVVRHMAATKRRRKR